MKPIDAAWNLLKAIPLDPDTPWVDGKGISGFRGEVSDAHFRESLPNFPLGAHMQTNEMPNYTDTDSRGRIAAVLGGERNMRTVPISPYDSDITRQSAYQFAPLENPDFPRGHGGYNYPTANYQGGFPKTHRPTPGSNQELIDAISRLSPDEQYLVNAMKESHRTTHPTQKTLDEMNMSRDEYLQHMQENATAAARAMGLDNNLPGGRLGAVARYSQDMTPPEYQQSVFE
mgnify:CR=1 FL=1|tara:strand:+ start:494 stop:1183 length:690 start_codon:yes stop_codon:yes gene_type:complete